MKTVVYGATRNIYKNVIPCVNSVLINGDIDEVVLLIEDDEFPYPFPENVRTINISEQPFFDRSGVNTKKRWTYMCLMKCTMTKLFPDRDRVLFLDCDTIVHRPLSQLWDIYMDGYYYGAVKQRTDGRRGEFTKGDYYNVGVLLCNLEMLRDGTEDKLIRLLNEKEYTYPEQDCINETLKGKIYPLAGRYNTCGCCDSDYVCWIQHFAAFPNWVDTYEFKKYSSIER